MKLETYKWLGHNRLCPRTKVLIQRQLVKLHTAEIMCSSTKRALTRKITFLDRYNLVDMYTTPEYVRYIGCKEILKRLQKERIEIKRFIKNMNKTKED